MITHYNKVSLIPFGRINASGIPGRMTRMTGPDFAVLYKLINIHTYGGNRSQPLHVYRYSTACSTVDTVSLILVNSTSAITMIYVRSAPT